MINQSMRLKVFILPISAAVAIALVIFYVVPVFGEMQDAKRAFSESERKLEDVKVRNQKLQKIKDDWQALGEEKSLVETALPEEENADVYVAELVSKTSRSGVLLTNIKFDTASSASGVPSYICQDAAIQGAAGVAPQTSSGTATQGAEAIAEMTPGTLPALAVCSKMTGVEVSVTGTWEQMLDFFKYLEDMNRFSNIDQMSINTASDSSPDLLTASISITGFFKEKEESGNSALANSLAGQNGFDKKAIEKLKEVIYALYSAPDVSETGERNMFK